MLAFSKPAITRIATTFLLALLYVGTTTLQAQQFPLDASVAAAKAGVHSGPAKVHYATDMLARGSKVLVYRLDPDGWCAIRPPKQSFSIIPAEDIQQTKADLGIVKKNKTRAWVGTLLDNAEQPIWQVQLDKDEAVEILGLIESNQPNGQGWFQIKPPAGEYRWIHLDDLSPFDQRQIRLAAGERVEPLAKRSNPNVAGSDRNERRTHARNESRPRKRQSIPTQKIPNYGQETREPTIQKQSYSAPEQERSDQKSQVVTGWRPATKPIRQAAPPRNMTAGIEQSIGFQDDSTNEFQEIGDTNQGFAGNDRENLVSPAADLQQLELALSSEMIKDVKQWDLMPIRRRAESLMAQTTDTFQRDGYRHLISKVDRCLAIQPANTRPTGLRNDGAPSIRAESVEDPKLAKVYDAYGTLQELVRNGGLGQSEYVLQDQNGKITHRVKAAPGLNLHRFVKKKIGIIGQRGFDQRSGMDHVTAQRVVDLNRLRR